MTASGTTASVTSSAAGTCSVEWSGHLPRHGSVAGTLASNSPTSVVPVPNCLLCEWCTEESEGESVVSWCGLLWWSAYDLEFDEGVRWLDWRDVGCREASVLVVEVVTLVCGVGDSRDCAVECGADGLAVVVCAG